MNKNYKSVMNFYKKEENFENYNDSIIDHNNYFMELYHETFRIIFLILNKIFDIVYFFLKISIVYILWIVFHYLASHLYTKFCVPNTLYGFIISPFLTSTPHCQGLRWIIFNGANAINSMWILIGTWMCSYILLYSNTEHHNASKL